MNADRLTALRAQLRAEGLTHYLVPSSDEHLSEYPPPWRLRRPWLSGFTGSAGDLVVGLDEAWLFADGRYHVQAAQELSGTGISLSRVGSPGQLSTLEYLRTSGVSGAAVGFDPWVVSIGFAEALEEAVAAGQGELRPQAEDLVDRVWKDRPAPTKTRLVAVDPSWTGRTVKEKIAAVRSDLAAAGAEAMVVVKLDQLAWLLNCRSRDDVPFNPIFEGYAWIDSNEVRVFVHGGDERRPDSAELEGVVFAPYDSFREFLAQASAQRRVLVDPEGVTRGVEQLLVASGARLRAGASPLEATKARKTAAEQEGMRRANRRASAAKTRALWWLRDELASGATITERSFLEHLEARYAAMESYWGLSFRTISAAGDHSALPHYGNADETPLRSGEFFLIDSGTQNGGGTTDDTRTLVVGTPDAEQKRLYTLVLKCHIACAAQLFPAGTPGASLDAVTRTPLWRVGLDYDHGTGHGVGSFLNVHEGPFAISDLRRKPFAATPLAAGMVTSIEPGYYREGWGGIRIENLYLIVEDHVDEAQRQWLRFDPLTFIPLEDDLIDEALLESSEREWLETYRSRIRQELAQELEPGEVTRLEAR